MRLTRRLCLTSALAALWPGVARAAGSLAEQVEDARRVAAGAAVQIGTAPVEVAVAGSTQRGGDLVRAEAPWHIGSITKSFTATLLAQMAVEGDLDLDAPIAVVLPEPMHETWRQVTLRAALGHVAGLPANAPKARAQQATGDDPEADRRAQLAALWQDPVPGPVGAFEYSNIGYVLAGHVAEVIAGQPWEALTRQRLLTPLGLRSAGFGAPIGPGVPLGHRNLAGLRLRVSPDAHSADNPAWMGPAGTLHMSLADMVRWGRAHLDACAGRSEVISAEACRVMQIAGPGSYGLGWVIETRETGQRIWHNGSNTLWYAVLVLVPEKDAVIAVALNSLDRAAGDALAFGLADEL